MMQQDDLQQLAELVSVKPVVLSLYLNVDPHGRSGDEHKLRLRQLLSQGLNRGAAAADLERIERYFDHEYSRQGRAVACFSADALGFWRSYPLPAPVEDLVFVGRRPYLKPLTDIWDEYQRLGVVTVDSEGARAFVYHMGEIEATAGTLGNEVKRHKQGGWGAQKLQRHEDGEARHNLKAAAEWADAYLRQQKITHVVLAGSDGNLAVFRDLLPRSLQDIVVGEICLDMSASPSEAWERAFEVAQAAQRRAESEMLEQVITLAHKGGAAATGLPDTLAALRQGRVHHLLVDRDFGQPGSLCPRCEAITVEPIQACSYCGSDLTATNDAVNIAVQQALGGGTRLSMMSCNERLAQIGGIAAVLRY